MSTKIRQELGAARESLERTLARSRAAVTDQMVDECALTLEEIDRALEQLPNLEKEDLTEFSTLLRLSLKEISYRIRARPRKG